MNVRMVTRAVLASLVIAAFPAASPAQSFLLGAKAGLSFSNLSVSFSDDPDAAVSPEGRTGFVGGMFFERPSSSMVGLQFETLLSQKGYATTRASCSGVICSDAIVRITYLEIPVLARFNVNTSGEAHPYVVVGPSIAFRLSTDVTPPLTASDPEPFKGVDVGLAFGGGVDYGRIVLDFRYTAGLVDSISAELRNRSTDTISSKNRSFAVTVGYRFGDK